MPQWVDASGSFFNSFAADMGEYIGPWPLMPTGITDFADSQDELDFVVGLPNPADPDNLIVAFDDSYPAQVWGTYRFRLRFPPPTTDWGWYTEGFGGMPVPSGATPPPAGCHLYVVAYFTDPPAHPPQFYVPHSYAASGQSTVKTIPADYTDWLPGPVVEKAAEHYYASGAFAASLNTYPAAWSFASGPTEHGETPFQPTYPNTHVPVLDLAAVSLAAAQADIASQTDIEWGTSELRGRLFHVIERVSGSFFVNYTEVTDAKAILQQGRDGWHARNTLDQVGRDLEYGVDYSEPPFYLTDDIEHEAPTSVPHWHDISNYLVLSGIAYDLDDFNQDLNTDHTAVCDLYVGTPPIFDMLGNSYGPSDGADDGPIWIDPSSLDLVASLDLAYVANGLTNIDFGTLDSAAVPFSTLIAPGTLNVAIVWQPTVTLDGLFKELPDPPEPTHPASSNAYGDKTSPVIDVDPTALVTIGGITGLPYTAVNPRWRYYGIPKIVPAASETYQRMTERGDGLGVAPSPRRIGPVVPNHAGSEQGARVRRIGGRNTFI